ncbi:MAG: copper amine oxidase N-terminal domain-containing protein [Clostridia bacterium]|nr:copper amine oxidase N-terminal domain-containing protein [Clostridia bacterium]
MKIKAFVMVIVLTLSLVINTDVKALKLPNYGVPNVKYGWEQEYLDEGYSQEELYYLAGIVTLTKRNRAGESISAHDRYDLNRILRDKEELGEWKDVAWYYFVDYEKLEYFVRERKVRDGLITREEVEAQKKAEEAEKNKWKKRIFLHVGSNKAIVNDVEKIIDEENPDTVVFTENDRSYVPVRFLSEEYGGEVDWDEDTQTVNISFEDREITLTVGKCEIIVNGETMENDVAPILKGDRVFLPLRACVDAIGRYVMYNSGLIVVDENLDMDWEMKNMDFVNGFSEERFK